MMNSRLHPSQQQVAPPPHHHQAPPPPPSSTQVPVSKTMQQLASVNEQTWLSIGKILKDRYLESIVETNKNNIK